VPRRPRPSLFHPVNRPPRRRQSLSLSPNAPHMHGAHIERRSQPAAMTCVGVHGHSKSRRKKATRKDQRKGAEMAGGTQRLPASASASLRAFAGLYAYDASALYRHVGWALIPKTKRSLESISLAFYCCSSIEALLACPYPLGATPLHVCIPLHPYVVHPCRSNQLGHTIYTERAHGCSYCNEV
jgi:hypothetical protein